MNHFGGNVKKADIIDVTTQFGSGWAWLSQAGNLQDSERRKRAGSRRPILGVDVWEHSHYLDYRNARPKYLEAVSR
ncbi:hypothetical protein ASC90_17450 [Rhizobium sp. Root1220]|nr:hypothetical protein ASC90_17450 [Rhizobium sp. Root1220]